MMGKFRAIIRIDNGGMAVNIGGAVLSEFKTVDFDSEALAAALPEYPSGAYCHAQIVGIERLPALQAKEAEQ